MITILMNVTCVVYATTATSPVSRIAPMFWYFN